MSDYPLKEHPGYLDESRLCLVGRLIRVQGRKLLTDSLLE